MSTPTTTGQEKTFSQQDDRVVQRPPAIDAPGPEGANPQRRPLEQYAPARVSPGKVDENHLATNNNSIIGGKTLLLDKDLGFSAKSAELDNWTNQWLNIEGFHRSIPPYTGGWIINSTLGAQQARVALQVPSLVYSQPTPLAGEYVWVRFHEAYLAPSVGIGASNGVPVTAQVVPTGSPAGLEPVGIYGWIDGRSQWVPVSSYPSPTHFGASILETSLPQEAIASSHPAAGSTAAVTITNPATTNRTIIAIDSFEAALAQGTASTGQANTVTLSGSIGGTYYATPLVIGTVANTADRYQSTSGHTFVSGNYNPSNSTENLTGQMSVAGIANLFQYVTMWYRFGA